jgi:tetratricopeptide (TPR) repeat protein
MELTEEVREELRAAAGRRASRLEELLARAAAAYAADRYEEALRFGRAVLHDAPSSTAAQELVGLAHYRLGHWRAALRILKQLGEWTGSAAQLPVVMDCERALGRHAEVARLFEQLRRSSPDADVLVEGRLVLAASLAEEGRVEEAVALLVAAGAGRSLRHPKPRHLRQWYVLAHLYERAGDLPRARALFARVASFDPDLGDAAKRAGRLGEAAGGATRPEWPAAAGAGASLETGEKRRPGPTRVAAGSHKRRLRGRDGGATLRGGRARRGAPPGDARQARGGPRAAGAGGGDRRVRAAKWARRSRRRGEEAN